MHNLNRVRRLIGLGLVLLPSLQACNSAEDSDFADIPSTGGSAASEKNGSANRTARSLSSESNGGAGNLSTVTEIVEVEVEVEKIVEKEVCTTPKCVQGATQACVCTTGASGAQSCNAGGTWDGCVCAEAEKPKPNPWDAFGNCKVIAKLEGTNSVCPPSKPYLAVNCNGDASIFYGTGEPSYEKADFVPGFSVTERKSYKIDYPIIGSTVPGILCSVTPDPFHNPY